MTSDFEARVAKAVTPNTVREFRQDGAVCIRGLFNADEIAGDCSGLDCKSVCSNSSKTYQAQLIGNMD